MLNAEEISADKIKSGLGGYKKKATQEYLSSIRNEYDALYKENIELKDKISVLSEGVQYYKNMEKSLQKALVLAERTTTETVHAAEVKALAMEQEAKAKAETVTKEAQVRAEAREQQAAMKADSIIREAKQQADHAIAEGNEELRHIHSQIMTLIQQYEQYKTQYKQLAMAQMNVLESEAYTLEAPILKTIESALKESKSQAEPKAEATEKEAASDSVVQPVPPIPFENPAQQEPEEKEKKVYIDGRGQVVEVHEFREVTIPGSQKGRDPYFDDFDGLDEEDSFTKSSFMTSDTEQQSDEQTVSPAETEPEMQKASFRPEFSERSPEDYFKPQDNKAPFSPQDAQNQEKQDVSFEQEEIKTSAKDASYSNDFENIAAKESKYTPEDIRRVEQMQLERLRQEEERQANFAKKGAGFGYESDSFTRNFNDMQEIKSDMPQEAPIFSTPGQDMSEEDITRQLHRDMEKDEPISLSDLKKKDQEDNRSVPLPKASDEQSYFAQSKPAPNATDDFNQFAPDQLSALHSYENPEERNSLSYELDRSANVNTDNENQHFKSFRDFESEL